MRRALSDSELANVAADLSREFDIHSQVEAYARLAWTEAAARRPTLFLEDLTGIPFISRIVGVEAYQHRARVRAGEGDLMAAVGPRPEGDEEYCRQVLGFGNTELIHAEPVDGPMAVAKACMHGQAKAKLIDRATRAGCLSIHPYMSIQAIWDLAAMVRDETGVEVSVCGPPPPVLWIANDKDRLCDLASRTVGPHIISESKLEDTPEGMARALRDLARRHDRVALKRTRCASAMGNRVFESTDLLTCSPQTLESRVRDFLVDTEWQDAEPVIAVVWEDAICSPSTQLFLPPREAGPVQFDGVFEQILEGESQVFVGSRPSRLPQPVEMSLTQASLALAGALQHLGYIGVCSFDFLVIGDLTGDFEIRITECNGRWGGTSTPMRMVSRLVPGARPCYRAQDYMHESLTGVTFPEVLRRIGGELFDSRTGGGRFAFYNTGCLAESGKFDVIAFGDTPEEADTAILEGLPRKLGLS